MDMPAGVRARSAMFHAVRGTRWSGQHGEINVLIATPATAHEDLRRVEVPISNGNIRNLTKGSWLPPVEDNSSGAS